MPRNAKAASVVQGWISPIQGAVFATAFAFIASLVANPSAQAQGIPNAPTISAAWDASTSLVSTTRQLTVTLTNPNAVALTGVGFNAGTVPTGLNVTNLIGTCLGTSYNGGTRQLAMSGFTLAAGASCSAILDLTTTATGSYTFTTGTAFATGPAAVTGNAASTGVLTVSNVASPAAVPTMSEWAMILFGLILAGGAAFYIQQRQVAA